MARVILLNGSPHANGCTATALEEMIRSFADAKAAGGFPEQEHELFTYFMDGK